MAILDETRLEMHGQAVGMDAQGAVDQALDKVRERMWGWLLDNWDTVLLDEGWWIFSLRVKGHHLVPIWRKLFGPDPTGGDDGRP